MLLRLVQISIALLCLLIVASAKTTTTNDQRKVVHGKTTTIYLTDCYTSSGTKSHKSVPTSLSTTTQIYSINVPDHHNRIITKSSSSYKTSSTPVRVATSTPATVTITPIRYTQKTIVATKTNAVTDPAVTVSTTATVTISSTITTYLSTTTENTEQTTTTTLAPAPAQYTPLADQLQSDQTGPDSGRRKRGEVVSKGNFELDKRDSHNFQARAADCYYPEKVNCKVRKNVLIPQNDYAWTDVANHFKPRRVKVARADALYTTLTVTAPEITKTQSPVYLTMTVSSPVPGSHQTVTMSTQTIYVTLTSTAATSTSTITTSTSTATVYDPRATSNAACEDSNNYVSKFQWGPGFQTVTIDQISTDPDSSDATNAISYNAANSKDCCNACFSTTNFVCEGSAFIKSTSQCYLYQSTDVQTCPAGQTIQGDYLGYTSQAIDPDYVVSNGPCATFRPGSFVEPS